MPYFYVLSGGRTTRNDLQINPQEVYACSAVQPWTQGSANFARRWFALAVLLIAFGLPSLVVAQEDLLAVFGTVKHEESNKKLQGVRVVVYQDGVEFDAISTDARGGYAFDLPLRHSYMFSFELAEHSNKRIEVDASGIPMDVKGTRNMDLDMSMMPLPPDLTPAFSKIPTGVRVFRGPKHGDFRQQLYRSHAEQSEC